MATNLVDKNDYLRQRDELIDEDRRLRRDCSVLQTRSALEKEADEIVRRVRMEEAQTVWKEEHPDILHPFPGMEFLTGVFSLRPSSVRSRAKYRHLIGKKIIEKTQIFKILSRVEL